MPGNSSVKPWQESSSEGAGGGIRIQKVPPAFELGLNPFFISFSFIQSFSFHNLPKLGMIEMIYFQYHSLILVFDFFGFSTV